MFAQVSPLPFSYHFESKPGLAHARNRAITEAETGILIFTDDDVLVPQDWISAYVEAYEETSAHAIFGPILPEWGSPNQPDWYDVRFQPVFALLDYGSERIRATSLAHQFFGANFSCRTDVLKGLGGFDANLGRMAGKLLIGEETDLFKRLVEAEMDVWYFPSIRVWHVIRDERKSIDYVRAHSRDTAESNVYLSWKNAKRLLFGVPVYVVRTTAGFYLRLPFRWAASALSRNGLDRLHLSLELLRWNLETKFHFLTLVSRLKSKSGAWLGSGSDSKV